MSKSVLSENLKKARKLKGWSQEGAAAAIREAGAEDFKRSTLAAYEEGRGRPKYPTQKAMQKAFCIENWEDFMLNPNYWEADIPAEEIKHRLEMLPPDQKKVVKILLGLAC